MPLDFWKKILWTDESKFELFEKKYVKWTLGLDSCTPDYLVYKETNIDKINIIAGCRAMNFEEKAMREGRKKLVIEYIKEKERKRGSNKVGKEREEFYRQN
ncbi:hypothetical protein X777_06636 [Ooceraea biroi]|uniref:Uncharacterized protein n=1 Tax=Ooceraea biroi TaxID=2015173 RepID=A0A026WFM0_OOCBI|nr:hypothetical protein X777_06636 [Ooceraea biroi]